jgi:hypothetical protein
MKNKMTYVLYMIALFAFFMASVSYWGNIQLQGDRLNAESIGLNLASLMALLSGLLIIFVRNKYSKNRIHVICYLWIVIMPLVIYYNKGQISHYILTLLWPVFYEATYLLVLFNKRRIITFRKLFVIIWGVGLFYFILSRLSDLTNQSNTIYYAFLELPLFLCVRKKKNQVLILILFSVLALLSMKRSCIFAVLGIWTLYSCVLIMKSDGKRKVTGIMIVLFLLLVGVFSFNQIDVMLGGQISERMNKEETDEGRGRLAIYEVTWLMQQHSSMNEWLLGHGHNGVWHNSPLEISAHNDFMEVLYDYGLIVFILYLCLWGYVMNKCLYLYRINSYFLVPYISSICIFIVLSLVSHLVLYTSYFNLLVIFWAGVEAFVEKEKRSVKFRY